MFRLLHNNIVRNFSTRNPTITLLYCSVFLLFLGWLDIITGDYSLIVFYLIPVSLAAWFVSRQSGLLFCLLAVVVRFVADEWPRSAIFSHSVQHYWNVLIEFLFLVIMSLLFSALKKNLENEKELARRDPLTNTLNRRSFFDLAEHEINRSQRYDLPLTVAYIDLDNFKVVNDQLGHKTGDCLLMEVVATIRSNIRSSDILARFGGDEFVILLPNTPGEAALAFLNKVHESLNQSMELKGWPVSFSIGAATYVKSPLTVDEVIHHADELMYSVKHGGKNRLLHREIGEDAHG
ncbi:MAG: diguanylate cyclase [Desulfuromonadales bacterium]